MDLAGATDEAPVPDGQRRIAADVVRQRTRDVLHDWRTARTNPIQQLSRMLSQASQEYADRFLVELIQNGFDAHEAGSTGSTLR